VRLLEQALGGGYAAAALHLAMLYHLGRVVPADPDKATRYVLTAVDLGDAYAAFELASWYEDGDGVARDTMQALRWYEHAARGGSVFACTRLADAYSKGELDLPQDQKRAREFARMAEQAELP
jgi:TPR repeat protein